MQLQFLGAATTVTGSQFLLTTARTRILVDCGMFQGSPNESIRNRIPLAYDPRDLDAILLTHAHLDHCGLIPHVVARGFRGTIFATAGTAEPARLVLLDSARLQQEFARRGQRFERRHPDRAQEEQRLQEREFQEALTLASEGAAGGALSPAAAGDVEASRDGDKDRHTNPVPTSVEPDDELSPALMVPSEDMLTSAAARGATAHWRPGRRGQGAGPER